MPSPALATESTPPVGPAAFDLLDGLAAATTADAAWAVYMCAARSAGLLFGAAAWFSRDLQVSKATLAESMPEGWFQHYVTEGHEHHSPLMARRDDVMAFSWSMADWDGEMTPGRRRWRQDNLGAGIARGFNIPDRADGERKIISLCGPAYDPHPYDLITLNLAAVAFFDRLRELGLLARRAPTVLSRREAECLAWVAAGKSDWEIGEILGLSEKTVNHYVERAKQKLDCATRVQAVVLAIRDHLIVP